MNNRIMAALFALTLCLCLFIGVVPVDAEATECSHKLSNREWIAKKDATCNATGYEGHWECKNCKAWFLNNTTYEPMTQAAIDANTFAAKGHNFISDINTKDEENHWEACTRCGVKQNITAHDRTKVEVSSDKNTCKITCSCGKTYYVQHTPGTELYSDTGRGDHWHLCTVCNAACGKENHTADGYRAEEGNTAGHYTICTACDGIIDGENHTWVVPEFTGTTHVIKCEKCNYVFSDGAHVDNVKADGTTGKDCICDDCGKEIDHVYGEIAPCGDDKGHESKCINCKASKGDYALCNFDYVSTGNNTHSKECTTCGRSVASESCVSFDEDKNCVCDKCETDFVHTWSEAGHRYVYAVAPTCETAGSVEYKICWQCERKFNYSGKILTDAEIVVPALQHSWKEVMDGTSTHHFYMCTNKYDVRENGVVTNVTCTERKDEAEHVWEYTINADGTTHTRRCSVCGHSDTDDKNITCTNIADDGKCECICGRFFVHGAAGMTRHSSKKPTCTVAGNEGYYECPDCGSKFVLDKNNKNDAYFSTPGDPTVAPLGHDLACDRSIGGSHDMACQRQNCNYVERKGHRDDDNDCKCDIVTEDGTVCGTLLHDHTPVRVARVEPTCVDDGHLAYYTFEACGKKFSDSFGNAPVTDADLRLAATGVHTYGDWENEGEEHVRYCTVCNAEDGRDEHEDTGTENRCDVCGIELGLVYVARQEPTCTGIGYEECWESEYTGRKYADANGNTYIAEREEIPALGHDWSDWENIGSMHKHECQREGCTISQQFSHASTDGCFCDTCEVAMDGHTLEFVNGQAATCDKAGCQPYVKCTKCSKYYNANGDLVPFSTLTISAKGHKWGSSIYADDATDKHYAVCIRCGAKNFGDHELSISDPLSGNYHQMICDCGEVKLEKHYDNSGDSICDAAGCGRDLSGKQPDVKQHDNKTVVTGEKDNTNSAWTFLRNWMNNMIPGNAGSGTETEVEPSTSNGAGTPPASQEPSNQNPPSSGGQNDLTDEQVNFLQEIVNFFARLFSSFGG